MLSSERSAAFLNPRAARLAASPRGATRDFRARCTQTLVWYRLAVLAARLFVILIFVVIGRRHILCSLTTRSLLKAHRLLVINISIDTAPLLHLLFLAEYKLVLIIADLFHSG